MGFSIISADADFGGGVWHIIPSGEHREWTPLDMLFVLPKKKIGQSKLGERYWREVLVLLYDLLFRTVHTGTSTGTRVRLLWEMPNPNLQFQETVITWITKLLFFSFRLFSPRTIKGCQFKREGWRRTPPPPQRKMLMTNMDIATKCGHLWVHNRSFVLFHSLRYYI